LKRSRIISTVGAIAIALFILTNCTPAPRPVPEQTPTPQQTRFVPRNNNIPVPNNPSIDLPNQRTNDDARTQDGTQAQKISNVITKMDEIQSATVVVTGNTALVGVQFSEQYKGDLTDQIKKLVDQQVKNADPSIKRVVVTADPDLYTRIMELASKIEKGNPLSGLTQEIQEILNRINPK